MLADLDLVTDNSNLRPSHCEAVSIVFGDDHIVL